MCLTHSYQCLCRLSAVAEAGEAAHLHPHHHAVGDALHQCQSAVAAAEDVAGAEDSAAGAVAAGDVGAVSAAQSVEDAVVAEGADAEVSGLENAVLDSLIVVPNCSN